MGWSSFILLFLSVKSNDTTNLKLFNTYLVIEYVSRFIAGLLLGQCLCLILTDYSKETTILFLSFSHFDAMLQLVYIPMYVCFAQFWTIDNRSYLLILKWPFRFSDGDNHQYLHETAETVSIFLVFRNGYFFNFLPRVRN